MAVPETTIQEFRREMDRLRGRLFGTIEAMGLPERQEDAAKGVIRQTSYDIQANLEATLRRNSAD